MKKAYITFALLFCANILFAQSLAYRDYMSRVFENNIALTARMLDVDIAEAGVEHSKVYNDPTLSVGYGNNEDWSEKLGQSISVELSRTFTFGVRRSGIKVAEKEREESAALLQEYIRNLSADATIAFLSSVRAQEVLANASERERLLQAIADGDSIRHLRGEVAKTKWIESRIAAGLARNERLAAEADVRSTAIVLGYYMNNLAGSEGLAANGNLAVELNIAPLDEYTSSAINNRADLLVAFARVDVAEAVKRYNSASRRTAIGLSIGAEYNHADPSFVKIMAGVSVPLTFSNINKGARVADELQVQRAQKEAADARLIVERDVMQAYSNLLIAHRQTSTFTGAMLAETDELVAAKMRAYESGEISFVDFIETERSRNSMQLAYIDALYNYALCWVELQRAVGCGIEM